MYLEEDSRLCSELRIPKEWREDPRALERARTRLQRDLADELIPMLWDAGKYVVDITVEEMPGWMQPTPGNFYSDSTDLVIRATARITRVQEQHIVMRYMGPVRSTCLPPHPTMMQTLYRKMEPTLRGLFPWQYMEPERPQAPPALPVKRRLRRLMSDLAVWNF